MGIDEFVKSRLFLFVVIPAKAGIQLIIPGFRIKSGMTT